MECPVCGLAVTRTIATRPLLFQASALTHRTEWDPAPTGKTTLTAPALGRVAPVPTPAPEMEPIRIPPPEATPEPTPAPQPTLQTESSGLSLGPLLLLELGEALLLIGLNLMLCIISSAMLGVSLGRLYGGAWFILLPLHFCLSWAFLLVPIMLAGQSPLMGRLHLILGEEAPERRLAYSLLHLASLAVFPLSALCLILSRRHQTLGELLSGQEILPRPMSRMR
jgi:hypothetical protein